MPLTDTAIRNARPQDKAYKLTDGSGMFLYVHPAGGKYWRMKYHFAGKEKLLALGVYPDVSLAVARDRRAEARKILTAGNDPSQVKQETKRLALIKSENTFEAIAREWHENRSHNWTPRYAKNLITRLEADIFPKLGARPIADINAPELLSILRIIENRGATDIAHRAQQVCGMIFTYAIASGRTERNPAVELRGALKPHKKQHYAHLKASELPEFLQKLEAYDGSKQTMYALKLLLLTFVRTIELRGAEWTEIDLDKAEWRIPAERMKMRDPHIVLLSRQTVELLTELKKLTGERRYLFPNQHKPAKFMSENTMLYALYRMGYHSRTTGHGFRALASTTLNEMGFRPDIIERQLAHLERNQVRASYNHAQYLAERREMMQTWADFIDSQRRK